MTRKKTPRKRPTRQRDLYTPELFTRICDRIARGNSLRQSSDHEGIAPSTFLRWVNNDPALAEQYTRAREICLDVWADQILEIADDASRDMTTDEKGRTVVDHENINRARLRVDSRKWVLAKLKPRVYGDKVAVETRDKTLEDYIRESGIHGEKPGANGP